MSTSREGPNPLRPYYIPPSIGIPQEPPGPTRSGTHGLGPRSGSAASYASSAREIFSDIDYSDYLSDSSPSSLKSIQEKINESFYKYLSVLLSQPFDVAKTVLQVRSQATGDGSIPIPMADNIRSRGSSYRDSLYSDQYPSDDSDQDELTYFTSAAPSAHSYSPSRSRRRRSDISLSPPSSSPKKPQIPSHQLTLKRPDALMEVIGQEWTKEGVWGVWKGSNATFVYAFLLETLENWSRGLISALLNIPDPGTLGATAEILDTQYPWSSLGVVLGAAVATGLILAPLDLIRTKLMLTSTSNPKRSLIHNLRSLPSYFCPTTLMLPTILHSLITPTISHSTPLLLRSRLGIDPVLTPTTYSFSKFLSRTAELFVKLPLETVLRRGQMAVLASPHYHLEAGKFEPMVEIGPYRGVVGTMWSIAREEGTSTSPQEALGAKGAKRGKKAERKGQGVEGLWRGWRVGMWGLVGLWGAKLMSPSSGSGGEF